MLRRSFLKAAAAVMPGFAAIKDVKAFDSEGKKLTPEAIVKETNCHIGIVDDKGNVMWQPSFITIPGILVAEWQITKSSTIVGGKLFIPKAHIQKDFSFPSRIYVCNNDVLKLTYEVKVNETPIQTLY